MQSASETRRLETLRELNLLDRPVEQRFADLVLIVQHLFQVPMVSITLIDENRQWRLSHHGTLDRETQLEGSICGVAMWGPTSLVVADLSKDPRFCDSPFVVGEPFLRFYAGHPLHAPDGELLGVVCVMDVVPRQLNHRERQDLVDVTRATEREIARILPELGS